MKSITEFLVLVAVIICLFALLGLIVVIHAIDTAVLEQQSGLLIDVLVS